MNQPLHILTAGGDRRFSILARKLASTDGVRVTAFAQGNPETASAAQPHFIRSLSELDTPPDLLVLPLPLTRTGETLSVPLEKDRPPVFLGELLAFCRQDTRVYGGLTAAGEDFALLCQKHGISFTDYLSDEAFALKNADATAEAAVALAIDLLPVTLRGTRVLVTGGGRIARSLVRILCAMGAEVFAAARSNAQRCEMALLGAHPLPLTDLARPAGAQGGVLSTVRLVFNTIPAPVFGREELVKIPPDTLIIELASSPGGFKPEAVSSSGRVIVRALSLPGKTAPESCAEWLKTLICEKDPMLGNHCPV